MLRCSAIRQCPSLAAFNVSTGDRRWVLREALAKLISPDTTDPLPAPALLEAAAYGVLTPGATASPKCLCLRGQGLLVSAVHRRGQAELLVHGLLAQHRRRRNVSVESRGGPPAASELPGPVR